MSAPGRVYVVALLRDSFPAYQTTQTQASSSLRRLSYSLAHQYNSAEVSSSVPHGQCTSYPFPQYLYVKCPGDTVTTPNYNRTDIFNYFPQTTVSSLQIVTYQNSHNIRADSYGYLSTDSTDYVFYNLQARKNYTAYFIPADSAGNPLPDSHIKTLHFQTPIRKPVFYESSGYLEVMPCLASLLLLFLL